MTPHDRAGTAAAEFATLEPDELHQRAAARRDQAFGTRVTFSPKVFIPLTHAVPRPLRLLHVRPAAGRAWPRPTSSPDQVLAIAAAGAAAGCHEALFTLGEAPEERYPDVARAWLAEHGYASTSTTWSRCASSCSTRPACCRTPTPERSPPTSWRCCGRLRRRRG